MEEKELEVVNKLLDLFNIKISIYKINEDGVYMVFGGGTEQ